MATSQELKEAAGKYVASLVPSLVTVGLGTGSTTAFAIEHLGERLRCGAVRDILGVPTSFDAAILAKKAGIPLITLDDCETIHYAIDGADEVAPDFSMIKGGGAAHTREKIVDSLAENFFVIVDSSKLVNTLGKKFPLPVEVLPFALTPVMKALARFGEPTLRMGVRKAGPVVTDQGNFVVDVLFQNGISNPKELEKTLNNIPGVVENGLFIDCVKSVFVAEETASGFEVRSLVRR